MPRVTFTGNLRRHVELPELEVEARTVREALEKVFEHSPLLRSYVLDDQGAIRRHVVVFVGSQPVKDRQHLSDAATDEIFVMQAISGG